MSTYTGWHFLADPTVLAHDGGPVPPVGESISIDALPILCEVGFHASKKAQDALQYAPGPWLERIRLGGVVLADTDKAVGSRRVTLSAPVNVERVLRLFACECAERVLPIFERKYPNDNRPRRAIEVARLFADGKATQEDRDAAWDAARNAAWAAAWDAAGPAAWGAAGAAERAWQERRLSAIFREAAG